MCIRDREQQNTTLTQQTTQIILSHVNTLGTDEMHHEMTLLNRFIQLFKHYASGKHRLLLSPEELLFNRWIAEQEQESTLVQLCR